VTGAAGGGRFTDQSSEDMELAEMLEGARLFEARLAQPLPSAFGPAKLANGASGKSPGAGAKAEMPRSDKAREAGAGAKRERDEAAAKGDRGRSRTPAAQAKGGGKSSDLPVAAPAAAGGDAGRAEGVCKSRPKTPGGGAALPRAKSKSPGPGGASEGDGKRRRGKGGESRRARGTESGGGSSEPPAEDDVEVWRTKGNRFLGHRVRRALSLGDRHSPQTPGARPPLARLSCVPSGRRCRERAGRRVGRDKRVLDGTVFGWLPAEESDFTDDRGEPGAPPRRAAPRRARR
jgi:hypothetical protein